MQTRQQGLQLMTSPLLSRSNNYLEFGIRGIRISRPEVLINLSNCVRQVSCKQRDGLGQVIFGLVISYLGIKSDGTKKNKSSYETGGFDVNLRKEKRKELYSPPRDQEWKPSPEGFINSQVRSPQSALLITTVIVISGSARQRTLLMTWKSRVQALLITNDHHRNGFINDHHNWICRAEK